MMTRLVTPFVPTRVHGVIDYITGAALLASPWLLSFDEDGGAQTWLPVTLGAGAIGYSLLTNYELGLSKQIPMETHLKLDAASGLLLMISPWLFRFARRTWLPHVLFGAFEVIAALSTRSQPVD